jgi:hypothetical protein
MFITVSTNRVFRFYITRLSTDTVPALNWRYLVLSSLTAEVGSRGCLGLRTRLALARAAPSLNLIDWNYEGVTAHPFSANEPRLDSVLHLSDSSRRNLDPRPWPTPFDAPTTIATETTGRAVDHCWRTFGRRAHVLSDYRWSRSGVDQPPVVAKEAADESE